MKVIHLHSGKEGGAERFFVNLANSLHERGVEQQFVIRPDSSRKESNWHKEIEHCGNIIKSHNRWYQRPLLRKKVGAMVETFQPDAIVAWMPRASQLLPKKTSAIRITRLGDFPKKLQHFSNCDILLGNVPGIGERCRNLGWQGRVEIVSNFPREVIANVVTRASMDTPDDVFVISSAGRFVHRKGMDALIRATAKLDNAWLWLVGDGEEKNKLVALAQEVGLSDRLRFAGWQKEPAHFLAATDVFCMPSRHEPLGNVVLEAWSLGLPVVSSRAEGPSWFMQDQQNGLMIDIDDIDGYSEAFEKLRTHPDLRKTIVDGGTKTLKNHFSKDAITDQYLNLFSGKTGKFPL